MKKPGFFPLTRKVNIILLLTLVIGIGSMVAFFSWSQFTTIEQTTQNNIKEQSQLLYIAIQNMMMNGEAPIAVEFFTNLAQQTDTYSVALFRSNAQPAFVDNSTLTNVNERLKMMIFSPKTSFPSFNEGIQREFFDASLAAPPSQKTFQTQEGNSWYLRSYYPLINLPKCTKCHGSDTTIRGVLDIKTDITSAVIQQQISLGVSGGLFVIIVLLLTLILARYLRKTVIKPVALIGDVCGDVTKGNFERRATITSRDEIGTLAETVNTMVEGLYERYELSKFVSTSTLRSLREGQGGKRVILTILISDIRGFTSYTERSEADRVVHNLNAILSLQTDIIHAHGGDVDKYVGDAVVALFTEADGESGAVQAAIEIQKVMNEKKNEIDDLAIGIGIHTGSVILGMVGSQRRADFTAIGDAVNTASRLCDAAHAGQTLISDEVFQRAGVASIGGAYKLQAKGKQDFIKVHLITGTTEEKI